MNFMSSLRVQFFRILGYIYV